MAAIISNKAEIQCFLDIRLREKEGTLIMCCRFECCNPIEGVSNQS